MFLPGCESAERVPVESSAASHRPNGIVQTRTNDAGESEVALLVAPKGPDGIPVPLEHMRGVSLFPESRETRERSLPGYDQTFQGGGLYRYRFNWILRDYSTNFGTGALKVSSTLPGASDLPPVPCYTSDGYIGYKFYLGGEKQHRITFSNGTFTGVVDLEIRDDYKIYARFNETGIFQAVNDNLGWVSVYLPLQAGPFSGMDYETTSLYTGLWTATVDPVAASGDGTVLTPTLEFELRGLSFESVTFAKKPDDENGNTTGGTFQGRANFFREGAADSGESGTLFWRAAILQKEAGESEYSVIRDRIYGSVPGYSGGAVDISGEWDGKNNFGQNLSGEHEYAVILRAVLETELDVTEGASADGYIATPGGFSSLGLTPRIDIFPNPYMPFDDSNVVYDEFGEPQWPGYNYTDELDAPVPGEDFPDYDNDGVPDWEPFQENIKFSTFLRRPGYSVGNWTLTVKNEEGSETLFTEEGTGESVSVEWKNPPADLEPQMLQVELQFQRCLDQTAETGYQNQTILARGSGVRAQDGGPTPGQCVVESFVAELAYNLILELKEVQFGDTPLAERGDNGPYLVYDYINNEAPNDVAQWKKSDDKMVPVVMKVGSTVYAQARFSGDFLDDNSGTGVKIDRVSVSVELNGVTEIKLAELSQITLPYIGKLALATVPIQLGNGIGRHKARIIWEADISGPEGPQTERFVTPEEGYHMLYTVFGPQPEVTKNTGWPLEAEHIWYHPNRFRDETPISRAADSSGFYRSPLDLATYWASQSDDASFQNRLSHEGILERLAAGIYDQGNWTYDFASGFTKLAENGAPESFNLRAALASSKMECPDGSGMLKIFANYLGIPAQLKKYEHTPTTITWRFNTELRDLYSNYIRPTGIDGDFNLSGLRNPFDGVSPIVPPMGTGRVSKGELRGVDHIFDWVPISEQNPNNGRTYELDPLDGGRHPSEWFQVAWRYHQVTELNGMIIDCIPRFDRGSSQTSTMNPDGYLNQLNMTNILAFSMDHDKMLNTNYEKIYREEYLKGWRLGEPNGKLPTVVTRARRSAETELGLSEAPNTMMTESMYLSRLLWGWTDGSFKSRTHFNEVRLPEQKFGTLKILNWISER